MKYIIGILFFLSIVLSACSPVLEEPAPAVNTPTYTLQPDPDPTQVPTAAPHLTFTVCTANLPDSLFPYQGRQNPAKDFMLAIIQESPVTFMDGEQVPVILEAMPTLANGDLQLETVALRRGQTVVDAQGELVTVQAGIRVRPSGCRQSDCAITWDGEAPLEMDQVAMNFRLRNDITWSDGTPLTAQDSVFSFMLASANEAPGLQWAEARTQEYVATGQHTLKWSGRPGFTNADLMQFFWVPLPSHLFSGVETWAELAQDSRLTTTPLSYGPYVLVSRDTAVIRFEPNPNYFRSGEGLPVLDELIFKVVEGGAEVAWQAIQSGDCDMLDSSFGLEGDLALQAVVMADEGFELHVIPGTSWTQLVFGIQPAAFDEFFYPTFSDRVDYFGDAQTRLGFAHCLDRDTMLEVTMNSLGSIWPSFLPPAQSQLEETHQINYDPETGRQYLEQAGWQDHDGDPETPRQAWNMAMVPNGTPLSVDLLIDQSAFHQDLAVGIRASLKDCGVEVKLQELPAPELYAPGPDGPLFGRAFDLALLSWQPMQEPDCSLYQSWRIPTADNLWIGTNIAGFSDLDYDAACLDAAFALPGEHALALLRAETAFISALPSVPLFAHPAVFVTPTSDCDNHISGDYLSILGYIELLMADDPCR